MFKKNRYIVIYFYYVKLRRYTVPSWWISIATACIRYSRVEHDGKNKSG